MTIKQDNSNHLRPLIGVGVAILRDRKILLGKRKNAHGEGEWAFPGGHLEYGETIEACARREVTEETGLQLKQCITGPYTSDLFESHQRHYVTLIMIAEAMPGPPENREPEKCESWEWFDWDNLPAPLFLPLQSLVQEQFNPNTYLP